MQPNEYVENVIRTESSDFVVIGRRVSDPVIIRLDHAADGICTEAGELKDALKKIQILWEAN
jgi:hypothetical protein